MSRRSKHKQTKRAKAVKVSPRQLQPIEPASDQDLRETDHQPDAFIPTPALPTFASYSDEELQDDQAMDIAFGFRAPSEETGAMPDGPEEIARAWLAIRARIKAAGIVRLQPTAEDVATEAKLRSDLMKALETI